MEDDAFHGFSSDEEGVDLLSSILDRDTPNPVGHGEKIRSKTVRESDLPLSEVSDDELSVMKAKLKAMESEMAQLRQLVASNERPLVRHKATINERSTDVDRGVCASSTGSSSSSYSADRLSSYDREVSLEIARQRREDTANGIVTEKYSGLRIKNPLISDEQMKLRMSGRKMVRIPAIGSRVKGGDIEGDWVTIGVVIDKLPPKDSAKGDKFSVWKLSDLTSQRSLITLFLFGKAFQEHWKTPMGYVVGLLNPTIMPNKESGEVDKTNMAMSLDHPQKLMLMGISEDFTLCKANTKSGKKCTNFANKSDGGYCDYHVQGAYNKLRSLRMECQRGYGPSTTTLRDKLFQKSKTEVFFYGGQSFTASGGGGGRSQRVAEKTGVKLFAPGARESVATANLEIAHTRHATGVHRDKMGVVTHEASDLTKQALKSHSMGAQYLNLQEVKEKATKAGPCKSASQLLQEHSVKMKVKEAANLVPRLSIEAGDLFAPDNKPNPLHQDLNSVSECVVTSPAINSAKAGISLKSPHLTAHPTPRLTPHPATHVTPHPAPRLGDVKKTPYSPASLKPSAAKLKALALVQQKGPIAKCSAKQKTLLDAKNEALRKRVNSDSGESAECKKPKVDVDSCDVQMILNARSSHDWQIKEEEWEKEEMYFEQLEKKEAMEEKLKALKELSVTVVQCKQCNYVAEGAGELCRRQNHHLTRFRATKRFFECQNCKERCATFNNIYPTKPCRKCSANSYRQTCVLKERQGPKLPTETLLLRGEEIKFLNSLS